MTANDSQTPGRIAAPATRPRSGAEPRFGRVGIEFTSPNAGLVDDPARETFAPQGIRIRRGGGGSPLARSDRPSGRSIRSPVAALGASAGSRVAPPPGQCRSGQEFLHDCGPYLRPHLPTAQRAFPHQRVNLRTTWPKAPEPTGRVLRPTRHETVCPDATRHRGANARNGGETLCCPTGGMLEGGRPIGLGTQRNHRPTRPHRHSHSPSNLKVRPPVGGPALGSGRPSRGRPGGVHVRCRWRGYSRGIGTPYRAPPGGHRSAK